MKLRTTLPSLLAGLALLAGAATAKAEAIFQFGVFAPDIQLVDADRDVRGLRINFVYGENVNVTGVDLGIVNSTTGNFTGFGWAPGANLVEGDALAIQWSWIYSHTRGQFTGWQSGALSRISGGNSQGFQSGWVNLAESDFTGLQFGLFNRAASMNGVQIAFVNWTEQLEGLQIGLINIARNSAIYPIMPIVNWRF
jgi:hypothetical protein